MNNEIKTWEPLRKWAKAAARGETDKIPYIDIVTLIDENAELRAKVESLAADAERYKTIFSNNQFNRLSVVKFPEFDDPIVFTKQQADSHLDAAMAKEKA